MTAGPSWSLGFVFAPTLVCLYALIIPPPPRALPWKIPIVIRVQVKDESVWIIWPLCRVRAGGWESADILLCLQRVSG